MARTGQPAVRHVAAVERAFAVLDALADGGELGTNEIARRTGINASTVSRLLATLAAARFVEHVPATGRYRLSLRLVELGNAVLGRLDLRELARPHLAGARARRRARRRRSPLAGRARCDHGRLRAQLVGGAERRPARPAERRPRDRGGQGDARVRRTSSLPAPPLAAFTPRTITDRERARRGARARAPAGLDARRREEREEDLAAVAAPVLGQPRRAGRRSSASRGRRRGSTRRDAERRCRLLLERAAALSAALGCRPDGEGDAASPLRGGEPDEAGGALADPLRQLRVGPSLHAARGRGRRRAGPGAARRRARAVRRSDAGCRAAAARPRPRATTRARRARAARPRPPRVPTYSYFIASEIGPSATSATLTMISRCPDSTAVSTASAVASGSKGTSKVTSITGRLPETPGMSALVRVRRVPSIATPAAASSSSCSRACASDARRRSWGTTSSAYPITRTKSRNAYWMPTSDGERDQDRREHERRPEHEQPVAADAAQERVVVGGRDLARVPRPAARPARPALAVGDVGRGAAVARDRDQWRPHGAIVSRRSSSRCSAYGNSISSSLGIVRGPW